MNQRATLGRTSAVGARAVSQAAERAGKSGGAPSKAFVTGKTAGQNAEAKSGSVPEGFEDTGGLNVKKASQGSELPGRITRPHACAIQ